MQSKAKRYNPNENNKPKPFMIRGALLYLLPLPVFFAVFGALIGGNIKGIIVNAVSFAFFMLAASIARRGFLIEREYKKSIIAKAPKLPYKTTAAGILAVATGFASYFATSNSLFLSIILAVAAFLGFYLVYGLDPRKDKVENLRVGVTAEEVIEITSRAKEKVENIAKLKREIHSLEVNAHLDNIISETKQVIETVEKNPNDLSRARKFFNVYLDRTEHITAEYAKNLKNKNIDEKMKNSYINLLKNVEETLHRQKARLNEDDLTKLDVQIEVLAKQLKHEGV